MSVLESVRRTIQRHQLASPDTRVAVALSGGPDSTALLHVLRQLGASSELDLAGVVHFNHQLRPESDADEHACREQAASLRLPFVAGRGDVQRAALESGRSIEDAGHQLRTAFYAEAAQQLRADVVAVGHTRDDQAETFLLRLIRGAGSRGLAAMHPRSGIVIRPLLDCSRSAVRAFLEEHLIPFLHDSTNDDVRIPRNRVRAELLPLLTERFNPRAVDALARAAELAQGDEAYLTSVADAWASEHIVRAPAALRVDAHALQRLPLAIARRVLHTAMTEVAGGALVGFDRVEDALLFARGGTAAFEAPGHRVQRDGRYVVLTGRPAGSAGRPAAAVAPVPVFSYPLPIPGEVSVPEIGCAMTSEVFPSAADVPPPHGVTAVVPQELVTGGLAVRNRRPGDRLRPSRAGQRKLQDLLVDRKVPRGERDRVPIVTDHQGRIVWVAGHALDQVFRVSDPSQAVVVLRLKGVGGSC